MYFYCLLQENILESNTDFNLYGSREGSMTGCFKKTASAFALGVLLLGTAGCENLRTKEGLGTLFGAGTGALIGSQFGSGTGNAIAIAIGTLAGAWAGNEIGKQLDNADKMRAQKTAQTALKRNNDGAASPWDNPDSGSSGTFMPTRTYAKDGKKCRDFMQTVKTNDNEEVTAKGRACEQPDGTWRIVKE